MKKYDKVENSVRNSIFGIIFRAINLIGAFIVRTMLIYILGIEFVGLDGLFSSILQFLNLAELGFSGAIVYKLYKPIAEKDDNRVCELLTYYKNVYQKIGFFIFTGGIILIPFLSKLISGNIPDKININILYLIYLINTCLSYWLFAYKTAILNAVQRNDLSSKVSTIVLLFKYFIQIILLLIFKNYYIYVIIIPITTILINLGNMIITNKFFPQYICQGNVKFEDKKEIGEKVKALVYNKIGVVIINGSDNIIISYFLGLKVLGIYNSYYYIFNMLYSFFDVFYTAITGGIGNSIVVESKEVNYKLFKKIGFINSWIVGWCSICLFCLYKPFMIIWIGSEKTLSPVFSLLMAVYFYFWMIRFITSIFKNVQGLWWEDRYRAMLEGVVNLCLNILMVQFLGLYGVLMSTIIAMLLVSLPWETQVLYSKYFNVSVLYFYKDLFFRLLVTIIAGIITFIFCQFFYFNLFLNFIFMGIVCVIVPNLIFYLMYKESNEFKYMVELLKKFLRKFNLRREKCQL